MKTKLLKHFSSILIIVSLLFIGCENPSSSSSSDVIPDFIPQVAFSNISSGRMAVNINEETQHELLFLLHTPLLQSFKGNTSLKGGESYSLSCYGTTMNFDITPQSGGSTFLFEGTLADGSGWLNVEYTQSSKMFSFEQCIYTDTTYTDTDGSSLSDSVVYIKGTDISIDNSGYFQGWYEVAYAVNSDDGSWEIGAMDAELYRGEMNIAGDIGTGAALFSDADSDPNTGTRLFTGEARDAFPAGAPMTISSDNLADWATALSSTELKSQDNSNDFTEGFWEIYYHLDGSSDYIRVSDDSVDESTQYNEFETGFKAGFTESYAGADPATRADLTGWQQSSLIIARMES